MQTVLNNTLKFIEFNRDDEAPLEDLHAKHNISPLNIANNSRTKKIREVKRVTEPEHCNNLTVNHEREHKWFPKTRNTTTLAHLKPLLLDCSNFV